MDAPWVASNLHWPKNECTAADQAHALALARANMTPLPFNASLAERIAEMKEIRRQLGPTGKEKVRK